MANPHPLPDHVSAPGPETGPPDPGLALARRMAKSYSRLSRPVVLVGPVGSGKTTLAREIHAWSGRSGDCVSVSAGELTEALYADALLGHVGGAFTGARGDRKGAFELARGGTLLLDDVAFMPSVAQAAILRAVEDRCVRPLGASRDVPITCREVYAMTEEPQNLCDRGALLPDLRSRMGEFVIRLPSLRDRVAEIPILFERYATSFAREHFLGTCPQLSHGAARALSDYSWPGNLRELKGVAERAALHALAEDRREVLLRHLPCRIVERRAESTPRRLTTELARFALEAADGNKSKAAEALGVHRNTLSRYLRAEP